MLCLGKQKYSLNRSLAGALISRRKIVLKRLLATFILVFWSDLVVANSLFEKPVQTTPSTTMQSMMDLLDDCIWGGKGSCRLLPEFCHPDGSNQVWEICLIGGAPDDMKDAAKEVFRNFAIGAAIENGDEAIVYWMLKSPENDWEAGTTFMRRLNDKWYLYQN